MAFDEARHAALLAQARGIAGDGDDDDLGTESSMPWAREKLYQLVNHRYNETT
ncbi:MAG: hypothetical protein WCI67_24230 [Chloroflexales bacterium]